MESGKVSAKPLTKEESMILLSFIEKSKIIKNKAINATTNRMKTEEWERIADKFNAVVTSSYRTPQQLRLKWENLKKSSRKYTLIRMKKIKTGGGGPDKIRPDEVLDRVAALLAINGDGGGIEVKDTEDCSATIQSKSFVFTPRASGPKRKLLSKSDENRAARNKAIADYYIAKTRLIEANLENVLLQNKKLKQEIENAEKCDKS